MQTWNGNVYHMTCRGSRFADGAKRNPDGEVFMKNRETDEWLAQNERSTKNFIRKWGHFVKHDDFLKPIIPSKYDIGFIVKNCTKQLLVQLEPWCCNIYVDLPNNIVDNYINIEQPDTKFNLKDRIKPYNNEKNNEILVEIDGNKFLNEQDYSYIQQLPEILDDSVFLEEDYGEQFEVGNLKLTIFKNNTYEKDLIVCKTS